MKTVVTLLLCLAATTALANKTQCLSDWSWYYSNNSHDSFHCVHGDKSEWAGKQVVHAIGSSFCKGKIYNEQGQEVPVIWVATHMTSTCIPANSMPQFLAKKPTLAPLACKDDVNYIKSQNKKNGFFCQSGWAMLHIQKFGAVSYNNGQCQMTVLDKVQYGGNTSIQLKWSPYQAATTCKATQL